MLQVGTIHFQLVHPKATSMRYQPNCTFSIWMTKGYCILAMLKTLMPHIQERQQIHLQMK